ncbi:MAG: endonuclease domain-containing protein [Dehalococcoidia bacterium]|nr:endonuclease domain-containing protein [Dehalococcoidia bacterium]
MRVNMPGQKQRWQTGLSRGLKKGQARGEDTLWKHLGNRQLAGVKFHREQSIGPYKVDFMSFEHHLVVEVDASVPDETAIKESETRRTAWLEKRGYRVLKFSNNEVLENTAGVLEQILQAVQS